MINTLSLKNYGPIQKLNWPGLGCINLVIGNNGVGKSFILKAMYSAVRTVEEYKRGDEHRTAKEILADKLHWTFQADRIGELVSKGAESSLSCSIVFDENEFSYSFGRDTTKQISVLENQIPPRKNNSIFLPAKEVLSLHKVILKSREEDKVFGFDDTYLDLARALRQPPKPGNANGLFNESRQSLEEILGGKVEFDEGSGRWQFKKGNQKYPIGVTAEGIKKIAILDTLLGNQYLSSDSIIFIDEPEAALHPVAIAQLLDLIALLSSSGIQFFIASHSYFVVKKLFLIAQKAEMSIPVLSADKNNLWQSSDLLEGMPENAIIDESIRLYEEELELTLQ
jgi:AAA15 family ATPase/GTPase